MIKAFIILCLWLTWLLIGLGYFPFDQYVASWPAQEICIFVFWLLVSLAAFYVGIKIVLKKLASKNLSQDSVGKTHSQNYPTGNEKITTFEVLLGFSMGCVASILMVFKTMRQEDLDFLAALFSAKWWIAAIWIILPICYFCNDKES